MAGDAWLERGRWVNVIVRRERIGEPVALTGCVLAVDQFGVALREVAQTGSATQIFDAFVPWQSIVQVVSVPPFPLDAASLAFMRNLGGQGETLEQEGERHGQQQQQR